MPEFKKISGRIMGVKFSAKEQEAIDREIQAQLAEHDRKNEKEIDAIILFELRRVAGFGYKRLKDFYFSFGRSINAMLNRYELEHGDAAWLAQYKLKGELGIDLDEWERERQEQERKEAADGNATEN